MAQQDISNRTVDRRVRWELILAVVIPMLGAAVGYGALSSEVEQVKDDVSEQKQEAQDTQKELKATTDKIHNIELDVTTIKTRMENVDEKLDEALDLLKARPR